MFIKGIGLVEVILIQWGFAVVKEEGRYGTIHLVFAHQLEEVD
jgi:hypothetical protein